MSQGLRRLPDEVFYVETEPADRRTPSGRGVRPSRIYKDLQPVQQFLAHHPDRPSRVWRASVEWVEIGPDGRPLNQPMCSACGNLDRQSNWIDGVEYDWCDDCGTEREFV